VNVINSIILTGIVFAVVFFVVYRDIMAKRPIQEALTDEEIVSLRRMNNLFDVVPIHNGNEWKNLSVDDLVNICLTAVAVHCKIHQNNLIFSRSRIILEIEGLCKDLSCWMEDNANRDFYKGSNMRYLIEKPLIVAELLREEALKP
jgi:hypothetical protein